LEQTESDLVSHLAERERLASEVREAERSIAGSRLDLQEREQAVKVSRGRLEELKEQVRVAEMARAACEADRRHLDDLCFQELGMTAAEAVASAQQEAEPPDAATLGESIADVKGKIDAIGPVNLTAIQEFAELEERYTFLTSQQKDLQDSMESLRETIRRINRSTRERFTEAFEAIRAHFQGVFAGLFNGGRADLRLEEDADVLECGVEIVVQPPGKRLGNVHLLSGGEKSMAAIALLFAIFRFQPSPFCLLDEVDAALDDVNVNRFSRLLREYASQTQFILITHNKRSMESADVLYGVTMDEPGVSRLMSLQL
jgi:chromosome segregation protein